LIYYHIDKLQFFGIFVRMQINLPILSKQAIDSALSKDWEKAAKLNRQILESNPQDNNAKTRLGRAYIKLEKFAEAKIIFEEILAKDPINTIAQKNYNLATENNADNKNEGRINQSIKILIKEPGTTTQISLPADEKTLSKLEPGQEIHIRPFKTKLYFFLTKEQELGFIKDGASHAVYNANKDGEKVSASVIKLNKDHFTILLTCKQPIFKSEKQQEKPYMKTALISEPKVEIPELEVEDN